MKVGLIAKKNIAEQRKLMGKLRKFLREKKAEVLYDENTGALFRAPKKYSRAELMNRCDLVIVLGGDGTLLKTARELGLKRPLVLGVNLGNVGFLTEAMPNDMFEKLREIFKNNYLVDKRFLLRATVYRNGKKTATFLALNDAVINQGMFARLVTLRVEINQRKVATFRADGLIIATPTGSTAHALSAGGPIVHPKLPGLVIVPICPSALAVRPIVVPCDRQVTITLETQRREHEEIGLTMDGQVTFPLEYGDEIKVRKSKRTLYLVRVGGSQYYKMLREKLGWGEKK